MQQQSSTEAVEQWGIFELALSGPIEGNPFLDVELTAQFSHGDRTVDVNGFYDGADVYRVRFMPDTLGEWRYRTQSNAAALDGAQGVFTCSAPAAGNYGPVRVVDTFHFAYADGTPYFQVGTTCYVWNHQGAAREQQTLATLKTAPFNKLRMCVFPKSYVYNQNEPEYYPFEGEPLADWDYTRFNPAFFQHLEQRIADLMALGIEADLILFHPYDRWNFAVMDAETDDRYLRYIVARLAAYRNVWWSMANEFDLMEAKSDADWDRFFQIVQQNDPYQHLRSVHNCRRWYDHTQPWVTHASIQAHNVEEATEWRERYQKPVVIDECRYEGNIPNMWGNITAPEMVRLFWEGTLRGGYVGHGETYLHPDDVLWWSHGGELHGDSPARIAFYKAILSGFALDEFMPVPSTDVLREWHRYACLARGGAQYLVYFGGSQPGCVGFRFAQGTRYRVTIIDTWEMTATKLEQPITGDDTVKLPTKPYIALVCEKISE